MIEINKIYNENCFETMNRMGKQVDMILTSPPYNTSKTSGNINDHQNRYDIHLDNMTNEQYIIWTIKLFENYDNILNENGVILYNLNYASGKINKDKHDLIWKVIYNVIEKTNFTIADQIIWKKSTAIPDNMTPNKCTRICENVFVFCRKLEYNTFYSNKKIVNRMPHNNVPVYSTMKNLIEAKNNDGVNKLNKATFSNDFCIELLTMYAKENAIVYDSFMGVGTTAIACKNLSLNYIGSELSMAQCDYANIKLINNIQ